MAQFIRLTRAEDGAEYVINLSEVALLAHAPDGTQLAFTGLGDGFGWLHDHPAGEGAISVTEPIGEILELAERDEFVRVTPIEMLQDRIFEGPETFIRPAAVRAMYPNKTGPKNWIVFDSFFYVSEGTGRPEEVRSCVMAVRETADQVLLRQPVAPGA